MEALGGVQILVLVLMEVGMLTRKELAQLPAPWTWETESSPGSWLQRAWSMRGEYACLSFLFLFLRLPSFPLAFALILLSTALFSKPEPG